MSKIKKYVSNSSNINVSENVNDNDKNQGGANDILSLNTADFPFDGLWHGAIKEIEDGFDFIAGVYRHNERIQTNIGNVRRNLLQWELKNPGKAGKTNTINRESKRDTVIPPQYSEADFKAQIELQNRYLIYLQEVLGLDKTISTMVQNASERTSKKFEEKIEVYYLPYEKVLLPNLYSEEMGGFYNTRNNQAIVDLIHKTLMKTSYLKLEGKPDTGDIVYSKFLIDVLEKFTMFFSDNMPKIEPDMIANLDDLYQNKGKSSYMNRFIYLEMDGLISKIKMHVNSKQKMELLGEEYSEKIKSIADFYASWVSAKMEPIDEFGKIKNDLKALDLTQFESIQSYIGANKASITKAIAYTKIPNIDWEVSDFSSVFSGISKNLTNIAKSNLKNAQIVHEAAILKKEKNAEFLLHYNRGQIHEVIDKVDNYWAALILGASDEVKQKIAKHYINSSLLGAIKNKKLDLKIKAQEVPIRLIEGSAMVQMTGVIALMSELERLQNTKNSLSVDIMHELFPFISRELKVESTKLDEKRRDINYITSEYTKMLQRFVSTIKRTNSLTERVNTGLEKMSLNAGLGKIEIGEKNKAQHKV